MFLLIIFLLSELSNGDQMKKSKDKIANKQQIKAFDLIFLFKQISKRWSNPLN